MVKVESMANNQYIIKTDNAIKFQSYGTPIASIEDGKISVTTDWDYSRTTSKYLYRFIEMFAGVKHNKKSLQKAIDDGTITLVHD